MTFLQAYIIFTVMQHFPLHLTIGLGWNLALVHAQQDNFFSSDSIEPTLSEQVDDTSLNPDGFTSSLPDYILDQVNEGEADLFLNVDDPVASTDWLNSAALPDSCADEESSTNGLLRTRDGTCTSGEHQVDLPAGLFEDPEGYLRDKLSAPPVGQADQPGQGNDEPGDLGFAEFMRNRNRPVAIPFGENDQICNPKNFGISTTPMCSNPFTGSVVKDSGFSNSYTLNDAIPCRCLGRFCGCDSCLS